jgi:hypothetical protein
MNNKTKAAKVSEKKESTTLVSEERVYLNRYMDVKEKVLAALPETGGREYTLLMTLFFPKYNDASGRSLLRKVFNGKKRDDSVLNDFAKLPEKIALVQEQAAA